jgi:hypothetical protein
VTTKPDITIYRKDSPIGSARFHNFSSKIDLEVNGHEFTYKDGFKSNEGLGQVCWKLQGELKDGNLQLQDHEGEILIEFKFKGWDQSVVGVIEICKPELTERQIEEVIVSTIAEIDTVRKAHVSSDFSSSMGNLAQSVTELANNLNGV